MELFYLITVVPRNKSDVFNEFFEKHGVFVSLRTVCRGTTIQKTLDLFGIENTEKMMLFSPVMKNTKTTLLSGLENEMGINMPGSGIAMTIPFESVGGATSLSSLTEGQTIQNEDKERALNMNDCKYSLIIAIAEKGGTDAVMDAARTAGAGGGTVIHAKGTGTAQALKFLGVTIAAEKEMIFIVTRKSQKDAIMHAVMESSPVDAESRTVVFSLPVDSVAGLRSIME